MYPCSCQRYLNSCQMYPNSCQNVSRFRPLQLRLILFWEILPAVFCGRTCSHVRIETAVKFFGELWNMISIEKAFLVFFVRFVFNQFPMKLADMMKFPRDPQARNLWILENDEWTTDAVNFIFSLRFSLFKFSVDMFSGRTFRQMGQVSNYRRGQFPRWNDKKYTLLSYFIELSTTKKTFGLIRIVLSICCKSHRSKIAR